MPPHSSLHFTISACDVTASSTEKLARAADWGSVSSSCPTFERHPCAWANALRMKWPLPTDSWHQGKDGTWASLPPPHGPRPQQPSWSRPGQRSRRGDMSESEQRESQAGHRLGSGRGRGDEVLLVKNKLLKDPGSQQLGARYLGPTISF